METTATLLTLGDVAEQLETNEVSVLRLISRGRLQATRIPPDKWRVLPDEFFGYVRDGAQDFRDLRNVPDVLTETADEFKATELEKAVIRAAKPIRLSDSQAEVRGRKKLAEKNRGARVKSTGVELSFPVKVTPAIRAVVDGPIRSAFQAPGQTWVYENFGDLFLAQKLREALLAQWTGYRPLPKFFSDGASLPFADGN